MADSIVASSLLAVGSGVSISIGVDAPTSVEPVVPDGEGADMSLR